MASEHAHTRGSQARRGQDRGPAPRSRRPTALGPSARHASTPSYSHLTRQDSVILVEIVRQALEPEHLIALDWNAISTRVQAMGIGEDTQLESLEALEQNYLMTFDGTGSRVVRLDLTTHGYRTAITTILPEFESVEQRCLARVVNDPPTGNTVIDDLASELEVPRLVVDQLLLALEERDLVVVSRAGQTPTSIGEFDAWSAPDG